MSKFDENDCRFIGTIFCGDLYYPIVGYEGLYSISKNGVVLSHEKMVGGSLRKQKILKGNLTISGYPQVHLADANGNHKKIRIHRLVALTFIPNPENKPQVNHKNGIRHDNRVENLEWCTASENMKHSFSVLKRVRPKWQTGRFGALNCNSISVRQFTKQGEFVMEYNGIMEASRKTGFLASSICWCCKKKYKTAGGFKWEYANYIK